ncbi:MAG: ATP-binding cassette domain-containing protein [Limisphaerales bacterium]
MQVLESQPVIVRVTGFGKSYGQHSAVRELDLEVRRGEIYGLIGPDGAGKSSLMKAIAGVLSYDRGEVEVFGVKVDSETSAERIKGRLGFLPQGLGLNLYPDLSIEENIDFFARLRLVSEDALARRKDRLLAMTRLERFRDRPMRQLSGGMKQKLGLVCTLIHEPDLVILDEPTTGVDPVSRRDFWAILSQLLQERGISALVSTAYLDEATRFHRVSLLFDGRAVAQGTPEEIEAQAPGTLFVLRAEPQAEALTRLKARFAQVEALGPRLQVFVEGTERELGRRQVRETLAGLQVSELCATDPELEDVFIALLRNRGLAAVADSARTEPLKIPPGQRTPQGANGLAIEANGLVRDFGRFRAVDRVSFRVAPGEVFGLLGANGAGKSTVIKMLTGILPPSAGSGRVAGADMRGAGLAIKERIGYMSQAFSLYYDLTTAENIRLYAGIYGLDQSQTRERTEWILDMAALHGHESEPAGSMPMGLRQRLALGCALVHRPQILFLDEPTSGVDPLGRRQFWEILFRLSRKDGVAILVTTHYMSEAEHCDHLALMFAGRIVADASPQAMKDQVGAEAGQLLEITTDQPAIALEQLVRNGYPEAALYGRRVHVLCRQPDRDRQEITRLLRAADAGLRSVNPQPLSMEDVFVYRVTALENQERGVQQEVKV